MTDHIRALVLINEQLRKEGQQVMMGHNPICEREKEEFQGISMRSYVGSPLISIAFTKG